MIQQIPFNTIVKPIEFQDIQITNGYQLNLSEIFPLNDLEVGADPFFITTKEHNFITDPMMIYTFFIGKNKEIFLESEAISSSQWIMETNQPNSTGFSWPNIDSYFMHGFQPDILFVLEVMTSNKKIDPIMNIITLSHK
jgi:hypothetical protein